MSLPMCFHCVKDTGFCLYCVENTGEEKHIEVIMKVVFDVHAPPLGYRPSAFGDCYGRLSLSLSLAGMHSEDCSKKCLTKGILRMLVGDLRLSPGKRSRIAQTSGMEVLMSPNAWRGIFK